MLASFAFMFSQSGSSHCRVVCLRFPAAAECSEIMGLLESYKLCLGNVHQKGSIHSSGSIIQVVEWIVERYKNTCSNRHPLA